MIGLWTMVGLFLCFLALPTWMALTFIWMMAGKLLDALSILGAKP